MDWLTRDDCFDLVAFEECDHAVAAIPDTVSGSPNFISFDLATGGQHDDGFASLPVSNSRSTCRHRIIGGSRV